MPRGTPRQVFIDTKRFNSLASTKRYIRFIIDTEILDQPISEKNKEFVRSLLDLHPKAKEKIGCGIDYIYVRQSPDWPNKEFCIKRTDGSIEHFSWHWAVDYTPEEKNSE